MYDVPQAEADPEDVRRQIKRARFGDNLRYVAVAEGPKTEADLRFGEQVNTWKVNEGHPRSTRQVSAETTVR